VKYEYGALVERYW